MKLSDLKIVKLQDHTAAGTSAVTSDALDTAGYSDVLFLTSFGTAASGNTVKVQQSDDDGVADAYGDLAGTSVTSGTSDEDIYVHIYRPGKRYLKLVSARGTSSTQETIWAVLGGGRKRPTDNTTSGTMAGESFASPAEGTA